MASICSPSKMRRPSLLMAGVAVVLLLLVLLLRPCKQFSLSVSQTATRHHPAGPPSTRDVTTHEPWPEVEIQATTPGQVPETVHWLWCGEKLFELRHYLSVLSAIRVFHPMKIILHYTFLPVTDDYHTWFQELNSSVPTLELHHLPDDVKNGCNSRGMLNTALKLLSATGGVLLGENVLFARYPPEADDLPFWSATCDRSVSPSDGAMIAKRPFNVTTRAVYAQRFVNSVYSRYTGCGTLDAYDTNPDLTCIHVKDARLYPRDLMERNTRSAQLTRWLFYGQRAPLFAETQGTLIPRVSHYIRFQTGGRYGQELSFQHYLSVLSTLYVARVPRVYIHGDTEPSGPYWTDLQRENVTWVRLQRPASVFQQPIDVIEHVSDVTRYLLLYKYGGVYQDWDVLWVQPIPDQLLTYPAVIGVDMLKYNWVETANNGVLLARAHSHFLHHFLNTHRDYRDKDWGYNSLKMSYRTWELYPHTARLDRHLHVMCWSPRCFPTWFPEHTGNWSLEETLAVHVPLPKPPLSLSSPQAARQRRDLNAQIARLVLETSDRRDLMTSP